jgi:hypothetical protein
MLKRIVESKNNYYILEERAFYGPFHSLADVEMHRYDKERHNEVYLENFKFIRYLY